MANYNLIPCFDTGLTQNSPYVVDFDSFTPNPGEVYALSNIVNNSKACGIVESLNTFSFAQWVDEDDVPENCVECYKNLKGVFYQFRSCNSTQQYLVSPKSLSFVPQLGEVYEMVLTEVVSGFPPPPAIVLPLDCYEMIGIYNAGPSEEISFNASSVAGPFGECQECQFSETTIYDIEQCITQNTYTIEVTGTTLNQDELISFTLDTNPFEQLCGTVRGLSSNTPNATYIASFPLGTKCDVCLSQVAEKRIITNCLTGEEQVVWASALYELGESSYLQTSTGVGSACYEVGDLTESAVTITDAFLSYQPSTSCQECIQCRGYGLEFLVCGTEDTVGFIYTTQYEPLNTIFFHPISGCSEIIGYTDSTFSSDEFYSFYTFDTCEECTGNTSNYESWITSACTEGDDGVVVTIPSGSGYTIGDTFEFKVGQTPYGCLTLVQPFGPTPGDFYSFGITTEVKFDDCQTCSDGVTFGVSVIDCSTEQQEFVTINYDDYFSLIYSYGGTYQTSNGKCYFLLDSCVYNNTYPLVDIVNQFNNCIECQFNPIDIVLTAGTPYEVCLVCCPCDSGGTVTSVAVPHPTWTTLYGQSVVQANMVLIGGNGLNS